jgi:hypothetical protein
MISPPHKAHAFNDCAMDARWPRVFRVSVVTKDAGRNKRRAITVATTPRRKRVCEFGIEPRRRNAFRGSADLATLAACHVPHALLGSAPRAFAPRGSFMQMARSGSADLKGISLIGRNRA